MDKFFLIRHAELKDAESIIKFNAAMGKETEGIELDKNVLKCGVLSILSDQNKGCYFIAETGGKVVGQLMITYEWSDWRCGFFWWIQSVYVLPDYRQQNVFRNLYQHVYDLAYADKSVCGLRLYVDRKNERAKKAYENLGMSHSHYDMYEVEFGRAETK
ncbi:MAG: GNAT family N-acetyltransferase [Bacteroidota bacterium]|nr:GNAT family N-acetyltransferase [Bacteroidota bacterium]